MQEAKSLLAADIVSNPKIVDEIKGKYQLIFDTSLRSISFDTVNKATCIMAEKGWRCIAITIHEVPAVLLSGLLGYHMYAMMEKL